MKKLINLLKKELLLIVIIIINLLILSCGKSRTIRENVTTIIEEPAVVVLEPILNLKQEVINCTGEDDLCIFEEYMQSNTDPFMLNGIIYPDQSIINGEDISQAPKLEFYFDNLDYTNIEKIEYRYQKFTVMGEKIAESVYTLLNFTDNTFQIPIHTQTLSAAILSTEPNEINKIEVLVKTYDNIYYKNFITFNMYSSISFPIDIYRDESVLNSEYYTLENAQIHTLDIINIKNNLNTKLLLNIEFEINNTTKASVNTVEKTNFNEEVGLNGPSVYLWQVEESSTVQTSTVNPSYLIYKLDEYGEIEQIPYTQYSNVLVIENLLLKELEHLKILITSNFEKLNILGGHNYGTIYTNYSHCQYQENLNYCKCRYAPNIGNFEILFIPPDPYNFNQMMQIIAYSSSLIIQFQDETLVPNCTNPEENLILNAENTYFINKTLLGRFHKTENEYNIDIYLKDYEDFGIIGSKFETLETLEVQSGEITGEETLYGYIK